MEIIYVKYMIAIFLVCGILVCYIRIKDRFDYAIARATVHEWWPQIKQTNTISFIDVADLNAVQLKIYLENTNLIPVK